MHLLICKKQRIGPLYFTSLQTDFYFLGSIIFYPDTAKWCRSDRSRIHSTRLEL